MHVFCANHPVHHSAHVSQLMQQCISVRVDYQEIAITECLAHVSPFVLEIGMFQAFGQKLAVDQFENLFPNRDAMHFFCSGVHCNFIQKHPNLGGGTFLNDR